MGRGFQVWKFHLKISPWEEKLASQGRAVVKKFPYLKLGPFWNPIFVEKTFIVLGNRELCNHLVSRYKFVLNFWPLLPPPLKNCDVIYGWPQYSGAQWCEPHTIFSLPFPRGASFQSRRSWGTCISYSTARGWQVGGSSSEVWVSLTLNPSVKVTTMSLRWWSFKFSSKRDCLRLSELESVQNSYYYWY